MILIYLGVNFVTAVPTGMVDGAGGAQSRSIIGIGERSKRAKHGLNRGATILFSYFMRFLVPTFDMESGI